MFLKQPRPRTAGQSLAEFALFVPVLTLILLMAVDFGRVYLGWVDLTNVARVGANFAAQNPGAWEGSGDTAIQLRYRQLMARDAQRINCTLPSVLPAPTFVDGTYTVGSHVRVEIECAFSLLTPFIAQGFDFMDLRLGGIGDDEGNLAVRAAAVFTVRFGSPDGPVIGGDAPTPSPTAAPTSAPTATPTAGATATPGPGPSATPDPAATPTPMPDPVIVSFHGSPTSSDSYGGGPPGSVDENQIVGIPTLAITFYNTTTGDQGLCNWDFGDGGVSTACSGTVTHNYLNRGTYTVSLTVDSQSVTRSSYVLVGCKVPAFAGVRKTSAVTIWQNAGFTWSNLSTLPGSGNYKIGYQSLAGGLVNPSGGCSGATVSVGP